MRKIFKEYGIAAFLLLVITTGVFGATYTGTNVKDVDPTTPTAGNFPPSEAGPSIREPKLVLKNLYGFKNTTTNNYAVPATMTLIAVDATTGNKNIVLPAVASISSSTVWKYVTVIKIDSTANTVTVKGNVGGETINGATTYVLARQYNGVKIYGNGSIWYAFAADANTMTGFASNTGIAKNTLALRNYTGALAANDGFKPTHTINVRQAQSGAITFCNITAAVANTFTGTPSPALTAYKTGSAFRFQVGSQVTSAMTVNLNGLGAKTVKKNYNQDIAANDISRGQMLMAIFDGTYWQMLGPFAQDRKMAPYCVIEDQKASTTAGGTFTAGAWYTRVFNTTVTDTGISPVLNNTTTITLPVGNYRFTASAPAFQAAFHKTRLVFNDGTTIVNGSSEYTGGGGNYASNRSFMAGRIVVNRAGRSIKVQHRCTTTQNTNGMGQPASLGVNEIYTVLEIQKEDN